jgi:hypothetical protein
LSSTKTKFSIVPFTLTVNVGGQYANANWMDTGAKSSIHWENFDFTAPATSSGGGTSGGDSGSSGKGKGKNKGKDAKGGSEGGSNGGSTGGGWTPSSRFDVFAALGVSWAGCVEHRPGNWGVSDAAPTGSDGDSYFVPMFAPDEPDETSYANSYLDDNPSTECKNDITGSGQNVRAQEKICKYQSKSSLNTSGGRGPNRNCNAMPLLRLTSDATALHTAVNAMSANGNTNLLEGFMWGWRTISPNGPFHDGKPYKTPENEKIIILLTDGMNVWGSANNHNKSIYSPFGYYTDGRLTDPVKADPTNQAEARVQMDAKTLAACSNAKAQGVIVYTVGFSVSSDPIDAGGLDLLKKCASSPQMAYVANNSSAIVGVFEEIARSIGGLRLTR